MRKGDVDDMNSLLIFFALPVATIILSAVFQKIINSPIAVAATAFAIFLVITFAFYNAEFLIATIIYTILAFLSAELARIIKRLCENGANLNTESEKIYNNENNCENANIIDDARTLRFNRRFCR
ncbi:MAG: DUF2651 family protein [Clostridia bacterium]|nr:DUF2651 family protein [Clostridia bacterium]